MRKLASRKILKVHELVTELKSSVNTLHEKFQHHYQPKDVETSRKRKLLTPDPLTVALELNRNLRVKNACSAAIQKIISLASHQEIAQVLQTTWM